MGGRLGLGSARLAAYGMDGCARGGSVDGSAVEVEEAGAGLGEGLEVHALRVAPGCLDDTLDQPEVDPADNLGVAAGHVEHRALTQANDRRAVLRVEAQGVEHLDDGPLRLRLVGLVACARTHQAAAPATSQTRHVTRHVATLCSCVLSEHRCERGILTHRRSTHAGSDRIAPARSPATGRSEAGSEGQPRVDEAVEVLRRAVLTWSPST